MRKTIEKCFCDICGAECEDAKHINYPVVFYTDQTEGRSSLPYISNERIDVCKTCCKKILKISAIGAQGINKYSLMEMVGDSDEKRKPV